MANTLRWVFETCLCALGMLHALVARLLLWNLPGSTTPQVKSLNEALDREYAQQKEKKQGGLAKPKPFTYESVRAHSRNDACTERWGVGAMDVQISNIIDHFSSSFCENLSKTVEIL